jgi:hypothetical protein
LAVIIARDLLVEEGEVQPGFKDRIFQHRPGFGKTGPHELGRPIGIMHISRPMQPVEKLPALCHRAKQGRNKCGRLFCFY